MNYYEELGVDPAARSEEIRLAYKTLARRLHPDGQPDPQLRPLAEEQMKRLNEIAAILLNQRRRSEYDAFLSGELALAKVAPRIPDPRMTALPYEKDSSWVQVGVQHWFWVMLGVLFLGSVGIWYLSNRDPILVATVPEPLPQPTIPSDRGSTPEQVEPSRAIGKPVRLPSPIPWVSSKPAVRSWEVKHAVSESQPLAAPAEIPVSEPLPEAVAAPRREEDLNSEREPTLAGSWLFVPEVQDASDSAKYPATYIELVLSEEHGLLSGHYQARYKITDRPISPEVEFLVRGARGAATLDWSKPDGGAGAFKVTPRGRNLIHISWWTTHFGGSVGLTSGSAVLIRQQRGR